MHIVIYSGGMDSFTLLHKVLHNQAQRGEGRDTVQAISFDYGQRHKVELRYAQVECAMLGIHHQTVDLSSLTHLLKGSALTSASIDVPEGHYAEDSMRKTVVPGRNTMMLSIAMAYAESLVLTGKAANARIYYGAHAGDHAIYPDCRADYVRAMGEAIRRGSDGKVQLHVPFIALDKMNILNVGAAIGLKADDYKRSWTCYKGEERACGKCGSCDERREAFKLLGWQDPALAWENA